LNIDATVPCRCRRLKTGKVQGKTAERHTSAEFVDFLEQVVAGCKPDQEIHIILDNLSTHKTHQVEDFLTRNSHVKLHFTPTYSSWLNQVEIWFASLERENPPRLKNSLRQATSCRTWGKPRSVESLRFCF
jgi:transposase